MVTDTPIKIQIVKSLSNLKPSRMIAVKADNESSFSLYVTDINGVPYPLKDLQGSGGITTLVNTDGNLVITGADNKVINLAPALLSVINSALQSGDNISELVNDAGYITSADLPTKTSDLTNDGSDATSTYVETDELGVTAFSNDYNDLDNKPTIPTVITNHSELNLNDGTNPHGTTKGDVGLGNVDNTSDIDKPISNATQLVLDSKVDKVSTAGVERAYVINADGSQGTKATSEFGGSETLLQVKGFATDFPVSNLIGTSAPMSNIAINGGTADYNKNLLTTSEVGHQGLVALRSSANINSGFCFFYGGTIVNNGDKHVFFTQFKLPTVTDVKGYVGAHSSTTTADPTSACFLEIVNNTGVFKSRGTVLTTASTSFTLNTNIWYSLMIEFKSTTEVYFKIKLDNGTVVSDFTSTSNLPSSLVAGFSATVNMFSTVATTARDLMLLDYEEYRPEKPNHLKSF